MHGMHGRGAGRFLGFCRKVAVGRGFVIWYKCLDERETQIIASSWKMATYCDRSLGPFIGGSFPNRAQQSRYVTQALRPNMLGALGETGFFVR